MKYIILLSIFIIVIFIVTFYLTENYTMAKSKDFKNPKTIKLCKDIKRL